MTLEPITLSILGATMGALGLRSRRHLTGASKAVLALAESYLKGQTEVTHERERRLTIIATVTVLPLGSWLTEDPCRWDDIDHLGRNPVASLNYG